MKWVDAALAWAALLYSSVESFTRSMTLVVALVFAVLFLRYIQSKRSRRFLDGQPPLIITSKGPRQLRAKLMPTVDGVLGLPEEDYLEPGNKASPRGSSHGLDSSLGGQNRSKRIQNWMGFKPLGGLWQPSSNHGRDVSIAHQGLGYSTQWAWDAGPQLFYVASQPSQAPQGGMVKAAVAHRPDLWVSSAVINAVNGVTPTRTDTSVTHVNLMPEGGTKHVDIGPERYNEKYSYPGMPTEVPRVGYAVPDGCTIERTANGRALRFLDSDGVQYMHTQDAYGWWGAPEVSIIMPNTGGVELVTQGTQLILGKTYHIFDLVPVAAEWSESFGEVHIDPSVTISGTTDLDMTFMSSASPTLNYGSHTVQTHGSDDSTRPNNPLHRILTSALPDGNATLFRLDHYVAADWGLNDDLTGTLSFFVCKRPWGEGNKPFNTATAGEACWDDYAVPNAWTAGGGESSGNDYIADASPPTMTTLANPAIGTLVQTLLRNSWVKDWKIGTVANEGMTVIELAPTYRSGMLMGTDDNLTYPSSFYIEYTEAPLGNPHYYSPFAGNNFSNIASSGFQMGEPFSKTLERAQRFFAPRLRAA